MTTLSPAIDSREVLSVVNLRMADDTAFESITIIGLCEFFPNPMNAIA